MALHCPEPASLFISTINSSQLQPFDHNRASSFGVWSLRTHSKRRRRGVRRLLTQVSASAERENRSRSSGDGEKKEVRLNSLDLMALEFGRLLGESKEKTVSKVVRKKIDPGATYIGIEKQVKNEKTSILKQITIQSPKRAARNSVIRGNDFTSTSSLPALSSPPMRQKGSSNDFPPNLTRTELKLGKEEIVDEALLRRPLDQSPVKKSQGEDQPISEQNESMEMSKIRFQRLLQESSNTGALDGSLASLTTSLPNMSSGSSKNKKEIQVKISSPARPRLVSDAVTNAEGRRSQGNVSSGIPNLASPPSRQKGSAGMFSMTPRVGSRAPTEIPIDEGMDDSFLRKPTLIQPQEVTISLDTNSSVDGSKDVEVSVKKSYLDEDELNESNIPTVQTERFPNLASPPSRQKSSADTFYASAQDRARVLTTDSADAADDSLIRKPTLSESQQDTGPLETMSSYRVSRNNTKDSKLDEANVKDVQVRMPTDVDDVAIDEKQKKLDGDDFNEFVLQDGQTRSVPNLASPPSRQKGSAGMFSTTFHARSRKVAKNSVDESVGDSFLRKPTLSEPQQTTATLKTSSLYVPSSNNVKNSELRDRNVNDDDLLHRGTNVDIKINEQKSNLNENDSNEFESSNKTISDEVKQSNQKDSVKIFDEKSLAEEGGTSQEAKSLVECSSFDVKLPLENETSVQMKLMKPKQPNNLKLQPSQVGIEVGNPDFIPEIDDVNSQFVSSLLPEPYIQSKVASVDLKITNKTELETDVGLFLGQVEEASELVVQMSPVIESQEILSGNKENKQDIENGFSRNQVSTEPGSALPKQLGESTEILRKPLLLNNPQLSKQKDKEMLRLLAKQEDEEREWARADALLKSKEQVEVKLIGSNSAGLFASFGCLVGFLPSFELSQKRGLIDFSTWAQQKGIDFRRKAQSISSGITDVEGSQNDVVMEVDLKELRRMYTEEILKLISNFIGEKTKVVVKQVDKNTRRLKFSEREADPDSRGLIQKKAELMAELKVGDVVTCEVKSITPIGVFVELEGVAALIHHSEVSWNKNIDASSLLSIGEIIKARVCRLDRNLQRINLSLKQMQPDPLTLTLESVVGDAENDVLRDLEVTESEAAVWPELEDLIKELKRTEEISSVSKGRCLRSAALAPTFQVLLSTPQSDGYKLLARFGNEIQEVVVKTTLDREKMKECIRLYTFTEP